MEISRQISKMLMRVVILLPLSAFPQVQKYSFPQIDSLQKSEERNMVVFIHTDWCRYCQSMINTTFKNDSIVDVLNEKFWFAQLDAEVKQDITFNGHTFQYKPTGNNIGIHELALQLGTIEGKIAYPTLCILNQNYEIILQYDQFLSAPDLLKILNEVLSVPASIKK